MDQILDLINEMSPYLLLGFMLAGLMHAFIPGTIYSKYLSKVNFRSVLLAALFGIPIPLCSCGVIPTAMSLRREGASKGATVSFLIATPQTGVDSIVATFSLMGLPFAILRPIAALITSLFGGQMVNMVEGKEAEGHATESHVTGTSCHCGEHKHEEHCHCGEHKHEEHSHCGEHEHTSFLGKIREAFEYAFLEMMEDIGKWLVVGLIVAGLITVFVPDSFFEVFKDNSLLSMLLVLAFAVPMYLCATGSIPIAVALMMKGLTPGAGLVLLMAGPACNMASILVINKVMGRRTLITYLTSIITGAVGFGLVIDHLLPREWFISNLVMKDACCHEEPSYFAWGCTALLFILLANALWHHYMGGHAHSHAHAEDFIEEKEEEKTQKKVFHIAGMNCNHCRTNVENALRSCSGVTAAEVILASGEAIVEGEFDVEELKNAVESLGFTFSE